MSDGRMISGLQQSGFVTLMLELCRSVEISVSTYGTSVYKDNQFCELGGRLCHQCVCFR